MRTGRLETLSLLSLPIVRQLAGESPVFLNNLLNHDVDVLRFLPQHAHKRICHIFHQFGFLRSRRTFDDLNVDVGHIGRLSPLFVVTGGGSASLKQVPEMSAKFTYSVARSDHAWLNDLGIQAPQSKLFAGR